jgi:hypothetical protein
MKRVMHIWFAVCPKRGRRAQLAIFVGIAVLAFFWVLLESANETEMAQAQGYGMGSIGGMSGTGSMGSGMGRANGMGNAGGGGGQYAGAVQANIDSSILHGNGELLRNDIDYEDYLLQKRSAFAQQLQQSEQAEDKLRVYAEQRLRALTQSKSGSKPVLTVAQQGEAHDLIDWLKKNAEERANNQSWLKRQDQALAYVEQDQIISVKNQRNALHNLMEDNLAVQSQLRWNQNMALSQLHLEQNQAGAVSWGRPPQDGLANARGAGFEGNGIGGFGGGGGGGNFGRRWGY